MGALQIQISGPSECLLNCRDNGDGSCDCTFWPTEVGDYEINITFNSIEIPGSPFQSIIYPTSNIDSTKIKVTGAGIDFNGKLVSWLFLCHFYGLKMRFLTLISAECQLCEWFVFCVY